VIADTLIFQATQLAFSLLLLALFSSCALKYSRRPVYIVSTLVQFAVSVWSAKLGTVTDIVINVFNCGVGALAKIIVQMTVTDVFFIHQRGLMNALYAWVSNIGGSLAPVAAGYITLSEGWRWIRWWNAISLVLHHCVLRIRRNQVFLSGLQPTAATEIHDPDGSGSSTPPEKTFR
jgi:hypothetical protein